MTKGWRKDEAKIKKGGVPKLLHDYWADAFLQVTNQIEVPSGSDLQRQGVDRRLICENGHEILVEEKVRFRSFDSSFVLEEEHVPVPGSDFRPRAGWINLELKCSLLGCLWIYSGRSRFVCFSYPRLRSIYLGLHKTVGREIRTTKNNRGYETVCRLVPLSVLEDSIIYISPDEVKG